jgi:hypothetical protein
MVIGAKRRLKTAKFLSLTNQMVWSMMKGGSCAQNVFQDFMPIHNMVTVMSAVKQSTTVLNVSLMTTALLVPMDSSPILMSVN